MDGQRIPVKNVVRHEQYDPNSVDNDVALLELSDEPTNKDGLELVKLISPESDEFTRSARRATVVGWGFTERVLAANAQRSLALQFADELRFQPSAICNEHHVRASRDAIAEALKREGRRGAEIRDELDRRQPLDRELISNNMVCAGTSDGSQDACFGDSGGPLLIYDQRLTQVGIVSWGPIKGCGLTDQFGVYVRLARYVRWIESRIGQFSLR
jgi:secreted trypsin-like serine protease